MKWSLVAVAVLVVPMIGCGGEDSAEDADDLAFVVMEDPGQAAAAAPPDEADAGGEADSGEDPGDEADAGDEADPGEDPDPGDDPGDPGSAQGAQSLDAWEAECVADGEPAEDCACLLDLLREYTDAEVLDADQLDGLMDEAFTERLEDVLACFDGATADDL